MALTQKGQDIAAGLLWICPDHRYNADPLPVTVNGKAAAVRIHADLEGERKDPNAIVMRTAVGEFVIPSKFNGTANESWVLDYCPDSKRVDLPLWLAVSLGLCAWNGALTWGTAMTEDGTKPNWLRHPVYGYCDQSLQNALSEWIPF